MKDIQFTHNEPRGKLLMALKHGGISWTVRGEGRKTWYNGHKTRDYFVSGAINSGCYDVSKSRVDQIQYAITGKSLNINPATYKGIYIEKSETQDGKSKISPYVVCKKPQEAHPGYVYQRFMGNGLSVTRIFYVGRVLFGVFKSLPAMDKAASEYRMIKVVPQAEVIDNFCKVFGLDYGEIDMIDGHIIDVNNIPSASVFSIMTDEDKHYILESISQSIKTRLLA